ncbi:MAG: DUF4340 domain-containing protein [Planctomycetaceae bacterium]
MSRANIVLSGAVVALAAVYFIVMGGKGADPESGPAPRLFPEFNKQAADRIVLSEGWMQHAFTIQRVGSDWELASAGGYPVKAATAGKLLDAVAQLRAQNEVSSSKEFHKEAQVDEQGRRVQVLRGETVMADFRVGRNPKGSYQEFFIRKEGSDTVYRTSTLLNPEAPKREPAAPWDTGGSGFSWDTFVQKIGVEWIETEIFNMGDSEVQEVLLEGAEGTIKLLRKGQDEWALEQPEAAPADTDAVLSVTNALRYLSCYDVLGKAADVSAAFGLDKPVGTVTLVAKKKVEKKAEETPPPVPGEEEKKDEETKEEEEFVLVRTGVRIGAPSKRADRMDEGKLVENEYAPVTVSVEPADEKLARRCQYAFLVNTYSTAFLKKKLEEFRQKPKEPEKEEGEEEGAGEGEAPPEEPGEPEQPGEPKDPEAPKEPKEGCGDGGGEGCGD